MSVEVYDLPEHRQSKIPIWAWACLIAGLILLMIFLTWNRNPGCPPEIEDVTDCNGLVESYEQCEKQCSGCDDVFIQPIVDCYGQLLQDQLALENSTR